MLEKDVEMHVEEGVQLHIEKGLLVVFHLEEQNSSSDLDRRVLGLEDMLGQGAISSCLMEEHESMSNSKSH